MSERAALRVLLVEDDEDMVRLLRHILRSQGYRDPTHVATGALAMEAAEQADVILMDHQLPDVSGIDLLERVRSLAHRPAVVLVTGHGNESLAAEALRRGADDYLKKDALLPEMLPQVLDRVRRNRAVRQALEAAERDLVKAERMAAVGEMTVTLHHEINNPLMSASAEVELLLDSPTALTQDQRTGVEAIRLSLERIRDIIRRSGDLREADTTDYLRGVKMIDLGDQAAPAPSQGTAAVWIGNEETARVVTLLLRQAAYRAQRCRSLAELTTWSRTLGVSLLVIEPGIASGDPLGGFRPTNERFYRLIALVHPDQVDLARKAGADDVIVLPFEPAKLTPVLR